MNRRIFFRSLFAGGAACGVVLLPRPARAGVPGAFATEWTQILNKIQLLESYIRQGEQLRQEILMVLDAAKNTAQLPFQVFGPIAAQIGSLHAVVRQVQGLAYSMANLDQEFANRFKGYGYRPEQWFREYQTWSATTLDTTLGTLKAANLQAVDMASEEGILTQLRNMSTTSDGRLKATEVGLQLTEQIVQQMQKLRQIMLADIQSKQAYQAWQMQQGSNAQAAEQQFFTDTPLRADPRSYLGGNR